MFGYTGTILRVNLSDGSVRREALDEDLARLYVGGRGLATRMLMDEVDPAVDPMSEENRLYLANGPLSGTPTPTGGRWMAVTKSPLTGLVASSNCGGFWGAELKFAGYDMIVLEGRADKPTWLSIEDDRVELRDASELWGKAVTETTEALQAQSPDKSKVLCIGPAGENGSPLACIMTDLSRAAGRSGVGAVMGSKNLKAIVVRGHNKPQVADADGLKETVSAAQQKIKEHPVTGEGLPAYGTAVLVNVVNEQGVLPTHNYQKSHFAAADDISGESLSRDWLVKKDPCYRCPIGCGRYCKTEEVEGGGPEYETIWAFGADCGVSDLPAIIEANWWCNELGLDTISAGATIAAAMELHDKGYITDEELDGASLAFGDARAMVEWTKRMGRAQGLGARMAQGSYRLCEHYGMPELSMSVRKQELPAYDPRGIQGQALSYATSNRGGCHVRGYMISPEILGVPEKLDRFALEGKPTWTKIFQDLSSFIDASGLCLFTSFALGAEDYGAMVEKATGQPWSAEAVLEAGERIWNLERLYNLAAGAKPKADTLPPRLLLEPIADGPSEGHIARLGEMLPIYYKERGWSEDGVPTRETIERLKLD